MIALNALQESFRRRVLNALLVFGVIIVISLGYFSYLSSGDEAKFVKDIGLSSITFFGILIAIFSTAGLIPNEIEKRTIFNILSKPVSRTSFLLGKFLGSVFTVLVNFFLMAAIFCAVMILRKTPPDMNMLKALYLICLELILIAGVTLTVSTVAGTILNVSISFFI